MDTPFGYDWKIRKILICCQRYEVQIPNTKFQKTNKSQISNTKFPNILGDFWHKFIFSGKIKCHQKLLPI
jgi:hypothetical protein